MRKKTSTLSFEGRDKAYLDVDRMINEGLAGGSVHVTGNKTNIEEARNIHAEEKPNTTK